MNEAMGESSVSAYQIVAIALRLPPVAQQELQKGKGKDTNQEESIGEEGVEEDSPTDPAAGTLSSVEDLGHNEGNDDANELVT